MSEVKRYDPGSILIYPFGASMTETPVGEYRRNSDYEALERENAELRAKVEYTEKMGLRFGIMKTSGRPEGFLQHVWDKNSDHERMFQEWAEGIGLKKKVADLTARIASLEREKEAALKSAKCFLKMAGEKDKRLTLLTAKMPEDEVRRINDDLAQEIYRLQDQLSEARDKALEEAAKAIDSVVHPMTRNAAAVIRAMKGAKP